MKITDFIQYVFGVIGGVVGWFLGGFDLTLILLTVFMVADYITGVFAAFYKKELSSSVGFKGIFKKVMILCLVGMGHILDIAVLGQGAAIRTAVIFFYVANEGLSIFENCDRIGLPVPKALKNALDKINSDEKDDENED